MSEWVRKEGKAEVITKLQAAVSQSPSGPSCLCPRIPAQPLGLLVGYVDVVEATEEGSQDDHENEVRDQPQRRLQ